MAKSKKSDEFEEFEELDDYDLDEEVVVEVLDDDEKVVDGAEEEAQTQVT